MAVSLRLGRATFIVSSDQTELWSKALSQKQIRKRERERINSIRKIISVFRGDVEAGSVDGVGGNHVSVQG